MLKLRKLEFNNIRCFDKPQSIEFDNRDKLIQVDGRNLNTGGSSGAGKTTVFLALDYLFGINDIPATILQSRLTKDPMTVTGFFEKDGVPIKIIRTNKQKGLTVQIGSEIITGNITVAEEKIDQLLNIPRKVFKKMIHKKQKEGGFFLSMTPKEMYDFLVDVSDLGIFIEKNDKICEKIKEFNQQKNSHETELLHIKSAIESWTEMLNSLERPTEAIDDGEIEIIEKELTALRSKLPDIEKAHDLELKAVDKPVLSNAPYDDTTLKKLKLNKQEISNKIAEIKAKQLSNIDDFLVKASGELDRAKDIGIKIKELKDSKATIEESKCPTCLREWSDQSALNKIKDIEAQISILLKKALESKDIIDKKSVVLKKKEEILKEIDALSEKLQRVSSEIAVEEQNQNNFLKEVKLEHAGHLNSYNEIINKINAHHTPLRDSIKQKISEKTHELQIKQVQLQNQRKNLQDFLSKQKQLQDEIKNKNNALLERQKPIKDLEKQILVAGETQRLIKTYVLYTIQDTLDVIANMASDILSGIPNMATSTVVLEGCKENKDGSIKNEITANINMNGDNLVPVKSLSGGERTSIDISVDLAVIDVIESKMNKGADFFIIDEPFDGLDAVCKENYLEIIRQVDTNKRIIIVDHSSELKEVVSDVITVTKKGDGSYIV